MATTNSKAVNLCAAEAVGAAVAEAPVVAGERCGTLSLI